MSDDIDHLDWELDEGWIPIIDIDASAAFADGAWGKVTHFQLVPNTLCGEVEEEALLPARGLVVGVAAGTILWLTVALLVYLIVRR